MNNTSNVITTWSGEQINIFSWFESNDGSNAVVRARAGTGKTTTIIEGVNRAPETKILLASFNRSIADELQKRISNPNAVAKTLHAVGMAAISRIKRVNVLSGSERADWLARQVCSSKVPDAIVKMVSKLHSKGRDMEPFAVQGEQLRDIAEQFEIEPDDDYIEMGYDVRFVCDKAIEAMVLAADNFAGGIDYADMIFLPLRNGWLTKTYDLVVIDEAQDMTMAQLEIAKRVCRGRIGVVGDDKQAIYAFRGADSSSLDRLKAELDSTEFPLATTYRCGKAIVEVAKKFVPNFRAGENNPEGLVRDIIGKDALLAQVQGGDFILSRTNAPLVSVAMSLLRAGRPTRVAGRELGAGLKAIIRKIKGRSVPDFIAKLSSWQKRELHRASQMESESRRQSKSDLVNDQTDMLMNLAEGALSVRDIEVRIESLFDDSLTAQDVIVCSSVHRSKGLKANRVFIFSDTMRDNNEEEKNIQYVAITRAKEELVFVAGIK